MRAYYLDNRVRILKRVALRQKEKINDVAEYHRKWRRDNPNKSIAYERKSYNANPAKHHAKNARRKATKLRATPSWANEFFIEEAYELAIRRTKMLGFPWQVDHIVPLISKRVCGLHVENNLRVIPKSENSAKGNRYWPDA